VKKYVLLIIVFISLFLKIYANEFTTQLMLINNYSLRQNKDVWSRLRDDFRLSHPQTEQVKYYERLYTKNPRAFAIIVNNAKPYIYYILTQVERAGLPGEIALLPGVESIFNPNAKSSSNAFGMWQFISGTGRRFNLVQNSTIDERQSIVKSTNAAIAYLGYLYKIFGQWEPAIGAYNCGEGTMYRAVINSGQNSGSVDYYSLKLPNETKNYLPKLIALASIIDNPQKFGVNLDDVDNTPYFAVINPVNATSVGNVIAQSGVSDSIFAKLNPEYQSNSYQLSPSDIVLLPLVNQQLYYAANNLNYAEVKPIILDNDESQNDPVLALTQSDNVNAQNSDSSSDDSNNQANPGDEAQLDDLIANLDQQAQQEQINGNAQEIRYKVKPGDTLFAIGKKFKANIKQIRLQNKIPGNDLTVGQTLIIHLNNS
jgi:membrane-bound lytic murein transglycosylase D